MGSLLSRFIRKDRQLPFLALVIAYIRYRTMSPRDGTVLSWVADFFETKSSLTRVAGDVVGVYLFAALLRKLLKLNRGLFREFTFKNVKDTVGTEAVQILKKTPVVSGIIKKEYQKIEDDLTKSLKDENREQLFELPKEGIPHEVILSQMTAMYDKEKSKWQDGWVSGAVYHGGEDHIELQNKAFALFAISNPLHADLWPSVMKFEAEIVSMTANMLNGGCKTVCGTMTSGGTESIIMAAKTHRQWARDVLGITEPEIVAPQTAHAGIDKACDMLGIKLIHVPVDQKTFKVNPKVLKKYLTSDTIMIYSSSPNYPTGIIDPIEELSQIALNHGCGLHVDCCLGGFVLPFAKKLGYPIPKFNFELPGVTSMSADCHKYGYSTKGTSVILYRNKELRQHQFFTFANWPGGLYTTPGAPGSRPGALSAATYASLLAMGENGYLEKTREIIEAAIKIKTEARKIKGVKVMGDPIAMVVAFGSDDFNIYSLSDRMNKKGWSLNTLQYPPCIHICVTLRNAPVADKFIEDLRTSAAECLSAPGDIDKDGNAPIYGLAAQAPAGPVNDLLRIYNDVVLKV